MCRHSCGTVLSAPQIAEQAAFYGNGYLPITSSADGAFPAVDRVLPGAVETTVTEPPSRLSSGSVVRRTSPNAPRTPTASSGLFNGAPVYGHGPSLEEFASSTPLSVGSPQEVIDKTLTFHDAFGDHQRQLFLIDHAGLPLKTVLNQLELLGGEVIPVLRKELAARRDRSRPPPPRRSGTGPLWRRSRPRPGRGPPR